MKIRLFLILAFIVADTVRAISLWPFDFSSEADKPRLSVLMEDASLMIDRASDLAADGKVDEAVAEYRNALRELDRVEAENPDRVQLPEFNTLRNKRAYVSSAIDSLLLSQAQLNERPVAVSDTTELERKYRELKGLKDPSAPATNKVATVEAKKPTKKSVATKAEDGSAKIKTEPGHPNVRVRSREEKIALSVKDLKKTDIGSVGLAAEELLEESADDVAALNLKAAALALDGDIVGAKRLLQKAIKVAPEDSCAYRNLAFVMVLANPADAPIAKEFYAKARKLGAAEDPALEELLK